MRPFLRTVALAAAVVLSGCGGEQTADDYADDHGGNPAVYERILNLTDCAALQQEFDRATANNDRAEPGTDEHRWTLGYMTAAQDRMDAVGC